MQEAAANKIANWVSLLNEKEMPVFAQTAKTLSGVAASRESSASELSSVILQDPSMTARILKAANSFFYNPSRREINTITRAVVLLGFESIRSLCMSIAMVESLGKGKQRDRMAQEMAHSFHAATQARTFAEKRKDKSPEEVFVATLLLNIGKIAFWCFADDDAERLEAAMSKPGVTAEQAEKSVLGFPLRELTRGLSKEWQLGGLLENTLAGKEGSDPRIRNILLGYEVAENAENGWQSAELKRTIERVADVLYLPVETATKMVEENARQAVKIADSYGARGIAPRIPQPVVTRNIDIERISKTEAEDILVAGLDSFPEPDPMLQLRILRELAGAIEAGIDLTTLLDMTMEGIARAVGLDRVVFAMISPDRKILRARHSMGWDALELKQTFVFDILPESANLFREILDEQESIWLNDDSPTAIKGLVTPKMHEICGNQPFFAMPTIVNGRPIGLFYADRRPSKRPLDAELYTQFKHFCQQAAIGISFMSRKKAKQAKTRA